ncbi:MAG: hypothetical protein R3281_09495 [Balneolaceae bacterium]|nr:hypothetical protein [Balneolaceae bacterium]
MDGISPLHPEIRWIAVEMTTEFGILTFNKTNGVISSGAVTLFHRAVEKSHRFSQANNMKIPLILIPSSRYFMKAWHNRQMGILETGLPGKEY